MPPQACRAPTAWHCEEPHEPCADREDGEAVLARARTELSVQPTSAARVGWRIVSSDWRFRHSYA